MFETIVGLPYIYSEPSTDKVVFFCLTPDDFTREGESAGTQ